MAWQLPSKQNKGPNQMDRYFSQPNFNSPPPLISIRDLTKNNFDNNQLIKKRVQPKQMADRKRKDLRATQQSPKQDTKRLQINQSKGVWNKQIPLQREQKKSKSNNYRELYFKNIKPVTQEEIKQQQKQESVIQSEYLQLEDLSSIQKYQSYLPNISALDYYMEYPHFLSPQNQTKRKQENGRKLFDIEPPSQLFQASRALNSNDNAEVPQLIFMQKQKVFEPYDKPQIKQTDSVDLSAKEESNGKQKQKIKGLQKNIQQAMSKRQKNREVIEKITKQSYVNYLGLNRQSEEVIKDWEQLINQSDNKNFEIGSIIERLQPKWFHQKTPEDSLRLILTKKIRLEDYLRYLNEIQIILEKRKFEQQIRRIQKKSNQSKQKLTANQINGKEKESQKIEQEKRVTIHYENESSAKKQNESRQKQHILPNLKANKYNSNINAKTQSLVGSKYLMSEVSKYQLKDIKDKQFDNNRYSLKNRQIQSVKLDNILAELIEEEKPRNSQVIASLNMNLIEKQKQKQEKDKTRTRFNDSEILQLFAVLLVKISNKKCTVILKQGQSLNENATLSSASRFKAGKKDLEGKSVISQQIRIQFDEQIKNSKEESSSSTVVEKNSKKIKELNKRLENKDKQIEELRNEYEHIINNYMTTITNLTKLKNSSASMNERDIKTSRLKLMKKQTSLSSSVTSSYHQENQMDEKKTSSKFEKLNQKLQAINNKNDQREEGINYRRETEQFTFKNSKKGNQSRQQRQQIEWMGNLQDFGENIMDKQINNLRRSLPQKN